MRYLRMGLLALAGLVLTTGLEAKYKQEKLLVAVMPFAYSAANAEFAGVEAGLADALASELVGQKIFRMIERSRTDALLKELQVQQTGIVEPKTQSEIGKQLGAKALILGSVVSVSMRDEWRSVKFAEKTTRYAEVEAEAKLVDVETGELIASARVIGKGKSAEKHAFGGKIGELATKESVLQRAVQDLSSSLAKKLKKSYVSR